MIHSRAPYQGLRHMPSYGWPAQVWAVSSWPHSTRTDCCDGSNSRCRACWTRTCRYRRVTRRWSRVERIFWDETYLCLDGRERRVHRWLRRTIRRESKCLYRLFYPRKLLPPCAACHNRGAFCSVRREWARRRACALRRHALWRCVPTPSPW